MNHKILRILFLLFFPMVISCVDESSDVGSKWVDSSFRNVLTDTCTVQLSTIRADSISTSGDTICQIGYYTNEYRGAVRGAFFSEYNVAKASFNGEIDYVFDSITVTFRTTGDYLGDTLSTQHISIHRLIESVELVDNQYLYNTSSIKYEDTPLATHSFQPRPKRRDDFEVRLPDELGKEFLDLLIKESMLFDSQERFRLYFSGLAIVPSADDKCITGFAVNDSSMCITMYYRQIKETATELTLKFTPHSSLRFNQASQDFTNTPFEGIKPGSGDAMPSSQSENMSCLQGLSGAYTKIEFPHLNNLLKEGELVTIESAVLYLYPVRYTYGDQAPLPETLTLYTANEKDVTEGVITDSSGEVLQDGSLIKDDILNKDAYYSFDITSFMQTNLGTFGIYRQNLMLMLPNDKFLTTVEGLILGDKNHPTNNVKIQILYKAYN